MSGSVRTIPPSTTASEVARLFVEADVGATVVIDPDTEAIAGIVTESDVTRLVAKDAECKVVTAGEFMTEAVITIASTESIHTAATLMKERSIRRLPVVDDGDLVGILTAEDLAHYMPRLPAAIDRARREPAGQ